MSKGFRIKTVGFKSLEKRLEGMSKEVVQQVSDSIDTNIFEINKDQIAATPVDEGFLKRSNKFDVSMQTRKELYNDADYAAYVEFGTGGLVSVPKELTQYAAQFKGKGIRKINMPAQPFFFAPFFRRRTKIMRDILKVIGKFGK